VRRAFGAIGVGDPCATSDLFDAGLAQGDTRAEVEGANLALSLATQDIALVRAAQVWVDGLCQGPVTAPPHALTLPAAGLFANGQLTFSGYLTNGDGRTIALPQVGFTLATFTPADAREDWVRRSCDLSAFPGRAVEVRFAAAVAGNSSAAFGVGAIRLIRSAQPRSGPPPAEPANTGSIRWYREGPDALILPGTQKAPASLRGLWF